MLFWYLGNTVQVKQLHDWLTHWDEQFLNTGGKGKGKKHNDSGAKKAVLLSGTPGIGKTTSAKLVSQMLGFQPVEVGVVKKSLPFLAGYVSGYFDLFVPMFSKTILGLASRQGT